MRAIEDLQADRTGCLARAARSVGWDAAFFQYVKARVAEGQTTIEDQRAADWKYLLPLRKESVALVLGCGWGTIPLALSETCARVYAVDSRWEKIAFLAVRKKQQGIDNLFPVYVSGGTDLPFPDGQFDLVSMVGFQWRGRPSIGVRDVVRRVRGLLKGGGITYLCLGNRLSFSRIVSRGNSGSALPLHSFYGYKRIFEAEGFSELQFYAPLPSCEGIPLFYLPLAGRHVLKFYFRNIFPLFEMVSPEVKDTYAVQYALARVGVRVAQICGLAGAAKLFVPGFGVIARKAHQPGAGYAL